MHSFHTLWLRYLIGMLTVIITVATAKQAQAQGGQICRDEGNLTICGDNFESFQELGIDGYRLSGNLTVASKGGAPVLRVNNAQDDNLLDDPKLHLARFEHVAEDRLAPFGKKNVIFGDITFVNDPRQRSPLSIAGAVEATADGRDVIIFPGVFWVDAEGQSIFTPPPGVVPAYPASLATTMRSFYNPNFLEHLGLSEMYAEDATIEDISLFAGEYNVKDRDFFAQVTIPKLRLFENAENEKLPITLRITMDEKGNYSGAADGFKMRMAGMTGEAKGIVVRPGEFEASSLEFNRADNPSLPNLDPTNPNLVFRLESVKYKDGHFAAGAAVGIKDWQVGNAFKLSNQSVGLLADNVLKTTTIVISSTLSFPSGSALTDSRTYPMSIRIGVQKIGAQFFTFGKGSITNANQPNLNLGPLTFGLPATTALNIDPRRNFTGLEVDKVTLTWNANFGGKSGVQGSFRLGIDQARNLVFNVNSGTLNVPEIRTGVFVTTLAGTLNVVDSMVTFILRGTVRLNLPGNSAVAPTAEMTLRGGKGVCALPICKRAYELKLAAFELKIAGFTLGITNATGTPDGGFLISTATLKVPVGINSIAGQVNGMIISGQGNISIAGGSFELPPLQIGKISFVGVKGTFIKNATGGYEFRGVGIMPLPGLDPSGGPAGKKITVDILVRTTNTGDFSGMGVKVEFTTGVPGIPIGGTGMELLSIGGTFDLTNNTAKIGVTMRAGSTARIGTLPIATINAKSELQINPFMFTANGELSILIFKVANASLGVGATQGFNGGPGFNVGFEVNAVVVHGDTFLRIGQVTLSNGAKTTKIVAESTWALGIKKNQFATLIPPRDLFLQKVSFKGGHLVHKSGKEIIGLMTTVGCCIFFDMSVLVDLSNGVDVSKVNANDYKLFGAGQVRALAAAQTAGFSSQMVSASHVMGSELLSAAGIAADAQVLQEIIPVEMTQRGSALFGISYAAGAPIVHLQLPNGTLLSETTVDNVSNTFIRNTGTLTEPHQMAFLLKDVELGAYNLIIDNAPAEYEQVSYVLNQEPALADVNVTCGGSPLEGVVINCNNAATGAAVNVSWNAFDNDSPEAKVRVSYSQVLTDGVSIDGTNQTIVVEQLPLGTGNAIWELGDVSTGSYKVIVAVEDGQHAPVEVVSETVITVVDQRAPAAPAGLQAEPQPGELLVTWTPNTEKDVAGYEIGFGVVDAALPDDPSRFVYLRDMGPKAVELPTGNLLDAKLWGLTDNQAVFVGIRAYDRSGNSSSWSPLLRAVPWPLSPVAWTPIPNGQGGLIAPIEVAFDTALISETVASAIEVRQEDGAPVAGTITPLLDFEEIQVIGLRFIPATPLLENAAYTVVIKGGEVGVTTVDGRRMPTDYTWRFTASSQVGMNNQLYLPLIAR